ncbi:MAG: thioredoxin family protein [Planctomycetota bacterium]
MLVHVAMVVCSVSVAAEPDVFSNAGYEADHAAAVEQGLLHVVYVTAEDCDPCDNMSKRRWSDDAVLAWVNVNAIVTRISVDEHPDVATELGVVAVPTTVAFCDGNESGRAIGTVWEEDLLMWLDLQRHGTAMPEMNLGRVQTPAWNKLLMDRVIAQLATRGELWLEDDVPPILDEEVSAVLLESMAARVADDPSYTEEDRLLWIIRNGHLVTFRMMNLASFAASDYAEGVHERRLSTADAHHLRDHLTPIVRGFGTDVRDPDEPMALVIRKQIENWLHLNSILGEEQMTAEWAIRLLDAEPMVFDRMSVEHQLSSAAQIAKKWELFERLHPDPVAEVEDTVGLPLAGAFFGQMQGEDIPEEQLAAMIDMSMWSLADPILAAMMRNDDGETMHAVVAKLEELCGPATGWRALVVIYADDHGRLTPEWWSWIDEFDLIARHPDLVAPLQEALDNPPTG